MAYTDVSQMAADPDLRQRLYACAASLNMDNAAMWVDRWAWLIVASDDAWANAWSTAAAAGTPRPGWESVVITDEMILERVRAVQEEKGTI